MFSKPYHIILLVFKHSNSAPRHLIFLKLSKFLLQSSFEWAGSRHLLLGVDRALHTDQCTLHQSQQLTHAVVDELLVFFELGFQVFQLLPHLEQTLLHLHVRNHRLILGAGGRLWKSVCLVAIVEVLGEELLGGFLLDLLPH